MTRVALIDDHESVRLGLEAACAKAGTTVEFSGATVSDYVNWRCKDGGAPVDVVVLDLSLGDGSTVT
ncbi:MAG TPA: DNA-binding response regulator, partial [Microbacteriaceae bacterium]|nr:DNA-binding response regulator [Microbacteriaceae bacterium]